jgi:hypothetical protein
MAGQKADALVASGTPEQVRRWKSRTPDGNLRAALAEGRSHAYASGR